MVCLPCDSAADLQECLEVVLERGSVAAGYRRFVTGRRNAEIYPLGHNLLSKQWQTAFSVYQRSRM